MNTESCRLIRRVLLAWLAGFTLFPGIAAPPAPAAAAAASQAADAQATYRPVELASWVPALRTPGHIILRPQGVSFNAELAALPRSQKTDYLRQAMSMMQVSEPPKVSHAVLLKYGPEAEQKLVAYIEEGAASRMTKELKTGDTRQFFAFHVYNYAKGPALVITSFGPPR